MLAELTAQALDELKAQDYTARITVHQALEMRYLGQNYELELSIGEDALADGRITALGTAPADAVVLQRAAHNPAAKALAQYLQGDKARAVIRAYGYSF